MAQSLEIAWPSRPSYGARALAKLPITVLLSDDPADPRVLARVQALRAEGRRVERIAPSDCGEEFLHLGPFGERVFRLLPERGYASRRLPRLGRAGGLDAHRAAEKLFELRRLWNRQLTAIELPAGLGQQETLLRYPFIRRALAGAPPVPPPEKLPASPPIRSVDLICCTYNRVEEPLESLPTYLRELELARAAGYECRLLFVPQNPQTRERLCARFTGLEQDPKVAFTLSDPPGLPRARNHGAAHSRADLIIFVDDDVLLDPGFVVEYVRALDAAPGAIGAAGRVRSRINKDRITQDREVGQVRLSGFVETHFDSVQEAEQLVPITPIGASMAYRRERMNALLGPGWFDESLGGSAHREETTLGVELFRRGEHLVYAPRASLFHFEALQGGCETRSPALAQQLRQYSLEYLFLNRLYGHGALRALAPLLFAARDLKIPEARGQRLRRLYLHARGYLAGRRLFGERPPVSLHGEGD